MIAKIERTDKGFSARFERLLHHTTDDVWEMLTENEQLSKWFEELRVGDLRTGGFMKFYVPDVLDEELEIFELKTHSVLEFDWFGDIVRFELQMNPKGCLLVFIEKINTVTEQTKKDLAGWHVCLDVIKSLLDGESIQREVEWVKWHEKYSELIDEITDLKGE